MATLGAGMLTLSDWAKLQDPNNKIAKIAELLSLTNSMVEDMPVAEANEVTSHIVTVRTGLPTPAWRLLNQGVAPTKTTNAQIRETLGICEDWSETDFDLANLGGNAKALLSSELMGKMEAMTQEVASTLIYGNSSVSPEEFTGLAPRFSAISGAANGKNIVSGGGTGSDNSSIWLICWGPNSVFTIYPKGSQAGLVHRNLGPGVVETTAGVAGNRMYAYRSMLQWKVGLVLKDWRYVVRGANIDISDLVAKTGADLPDMLIKMIYRIPNLKAGRCVFYMNRTCQEMLTIQRRDDSTALTLPEIDGKIVPHFMGIPIHTEDALTQTEAQIT